ncbi:MAG: hypothetical protein LBH82_03825 [Bacteroidales bacterium]|jgi:hypothetical protein|nr:hypothetical protein [Bacteroidales bacterium]
MKHKKMNIRKMFVFAVLLPMYFCNSYGQNHVLLNLKNIHKNKLSFPGLSITDCIDSIYADNDTLFIFLRDTRKFYKDERGTIVLSQEYKINKRTLKIPIQIEANFSFVLLKTFDFICIFKKHKNQGNTCKIFSIKEDSNDKDKDFIDIKDNQDVNIRGGNSTVK